MHRIPVESSELRSIGYDPQAEILEVQFQSGEVYHYYRVPQTVYDALMAAPSCGRYFNTEVRERYQYKKLRV